MSEITKGGNGFVGYEYKELSVKSDKVSFYIDGYRCFGWVADGNITPQKSGTQVIIKIKRDRKILNKVELTRLQRHFEGCVDEIKIFEKSKISAARIGSITIGLLGTVFMALSTFAVTNEPPQILLCVLFAIPGFIGWGLPSFIYKAVLKRRTKKISPLIEQKYDEIYEICEKGNSLI